MSSLDYFNYASQSVLVIGASGFDIVGYLAKNPQAGTSIPATIRTSFGGVARNVAENLARLGLDVHLITIVGNDFYGKELLNKTSTAGVNIHPCFVSEEKRTGTYLAVVNEKGSLQLALDDMQILQHLNAEKIKQHEDLFKKVGLVFIDMNLPPKTIRTIFHLAHQANVPVCADPTSTQLAARTLPYLSRMMLVTPNVNEASILCDGEIITGDPKSSIQAARCIVSKGVKVALVTMAEFGVCYATAETSGYIPAIKTKIVDPTGVGDALTATTIFGLLNQIPLDEAIRLGVSAATLTLKYPGSVHPDLTLEKLYDQLVI